MSEFRISRKVSLPIKSGKNTEFLPESIPFKDHKDLMEQVSIAVKNNMPVLLVGETGSGKNALIRWLAYNTKNGYRRVNHNGGTTIDDIVGKTLVNKDGTYWVDGVLTSALKKGYYFVADEINAVSSEISFIYHSLLDDDGYIVLSEHEGEIIKPHPNFRFFATMNPPETYSGTKELNKALLSRFVVVNSDFPSPAIETKILTERTDVKKEIAERMVKFATTIRTSSKVEFVLSTRELLMWAYMYRFYRKFIKSAETTILNKVEKEEREVVKDQLVLHFKDLDETRGKSAKRKTKVKGTKIVKL